MIHIDHIYLHLPASMQPQARTLTDHLARALSRLQLSQGAHIESLQLGPVAIDARQGVSAAASEMAAQIHQAVEGGNHARRR